MFAIYLLLDYINIFQLLGLSFGRININVLEILTNAMVVIALYAVTYWTIDKKQIEKEKNSKEMANVLLINTYKRCIDTLPFVHDREFVKKFIVMKTDSKEKEQDEEIAQNLCTSPFFTSDTILRLAENGYIEKEILENYLIIQKDFKHWVSSKIAFCDLDGTGTIDEQRFYNNMQLNLERLKEMLEKELERLS